MRKKYNYSEIYVKYSGYFGFTKEEVKTMLSCYSKAKKYQEVCDWYDVYRFGNQEIFNPWSVFNYLANDCIPKHYWNQTSSNEIISELLLNSNNDVDQKLNDLLMNKTITTQINFDVIYLNLQDNSNYNNIFSFLLLTGYLKQIEEKKYDESMLNNNINNIIKVGIAFCGKKTHICDYI